MTPRLPILPIELQDEIFAIAADDLYQSSNFWPLVKLGFVDKRRYEQISAIVHSIHAVPYRFFSIGPIEAKSPPDKILFDDASRVGKYVRNLLVWAAPSFKSSAYTDPLPIFSKLTSVKALTLLILADMEEGRWHEIMRTARLWPTERLQMFMVCTSASARFYDVLFNGQQVDVPRCPPVSQWSLTHLSFGSDYDTPSDLPFSWLLGCTPSVLGRLTHVRVTFRAKAHCEPFDVSWGLLFAKLAVAKILILQFPYPPIEERRRQIEALPRKEEEKRLLCCSYPGQVAMGSLNWDGRGARDKEGRCVDAWEVAELLNSAERAHIDQYFMGHNIE